MEYLERNGLERHPLHDQVSHSLILQLISPCLQYITSSCPRWLADAAEALSAQPESAQTSVAQINVLGC